MEAARMHSNVNVHTRTTRLSVYMHSVQKYLIFASVFLFM